ncbi:MAG: glycosyltransferase family 2 protein [Sphingobacteriaceae bacterium]
MDLDLRTYELSVIMIVNNGELYIEKAIRSILDQTYFNFEFLILNDGSTDRSEEIILSYQKKDQRIKYLKNSQKMGLSFARNKIIKEASGKYIAVADSDDYSIKTRFEKQMEIMLSNTNIDVLGSSVILMNDKDELFDTWFYPTSNSVIKKELANSCSVANPTCIFKKEVFEMINGYNESLTICEDWDFFYRASASFTFENTTEAYIHYRIHNNNISNNKLEHNIVFSAYLKYKLKPSYAGFGLLQLSENFPEMKMFLAEKIIQFYTFWMDTYAKLGYDQLSKELYLSVINNFFTLFSKDQKLKFRKHCLSIFLKNKHFIESFKIILNLN